MFKQNTTNRHPNLQYYQCTQQTQQVQQKRQKTSHVTKHNSGQAQEKLNKTCSVKFKQNVQKKSKRKEKKHNQQCHRQRIIYGKLSAKQNTTPATKKTYKQQKQHGEKDSIKKNNKMTTTIQY